MARNINPTKVMGSDKFLPAVQVVLDGYGKTDPPTNKKLPVESNVPELLVDLGYGKGGTPHSRAIVTLHSSHSIISSASVNTPSKVSATTQNKRYNLNLKTFNSSNGITQAFSRAYQKTPL